MPLHKACILKGNQGSGMVEPIWNPSISEVEEEEDLEFETSLRYIARPHL